MLPKTQLTTQQTKKLLSFSLMGDLMEYANRLSMDAFIEAQKKHPDVSIDGLSNDILNLAIETQTYRGIPQESAQRFLALASDRQQFKRAIVSQIVSDTKNGLGLEEPEIVLILGYLRIAPLFDEFFLQWRDRVIYSDLGKQFASDDTLSTTFRTKHNLLLKPYVFSVIAQDGDTYKEQPLIEAFPTIMKRIIDELTKLSNELVEKDGDVEYIDYLNAYVDLLSNTDPQTDEFFSKTLDGLWLQLQGRFIPVHSMEVYEDPGKYIVEPEFTLYCVDERFDDVNDKIENTRSVLIESLKNRYASHASLKASVPLMEKARVKVYITVSESASRLAMRPFGENIPNWDEIRINEGVRIIINMETAEIRWINKRKNFVKMFGEATVKEKIDPHYDDERRILKYEAIVNVGGHEVAHNAFIQDTTMERITPPLFAKLEEIKATFAIISSVDEDYTPEEMRIVVLAELSSAGMNLSFPDDISKVAYVYDSIATMKSALEVGLVVDEGDHYSLHDEDDKIEAYLQSVKKKFDGIAHIYEKGTPQEAEDFIAEQFSRTDEIQKVITILTS
jgi:hypothetical protein